MNFELLWNVMNVVMVFWVLMIVGGWWRGTEAVMRSPYVAIVPVLVYVIVVIPEAATVLSEVSNPSVERIGALLATPAGATLAWAHFLAFDLLVGRWIYLDSRERRIPWLLVAPALFFTLMLGPVGFLIYMIERGVFAFIRREPAAAVLDPALQRS
ncbi:MAG: ABA4-like family protein [Chloroflexota bacterium]